jgi:ribosomal protein S18 acetylase RimI-like enzyme
MTDHLSIQEYSEFNPHELFMLFRDIYLSSAFMSDDFDRKFPTSEDFTRHHAMILNKPGSVAKIPVFGQKPVGFLIVDPNEAKHLSHTSWVNMGIAENYRGKGIGNVLLAAGINQVKKQNIIEIIYLMVRAENTGAIRLYENSGFVKLVTLERDTKIGDAYFDGILMRRFI